MNGPPRRGFSYQFAGTVVLLIATLAASRVTAERPSTALAEPLEGIPFEVAGFSASDNPPIQESVLKELKATSIITRTYRKAGMAADVFVAFYAQQRAGESMHSPKHCLPGSGWEIWDYDSVEIPSGNQRFTVNKYSISHDVDRRLVLYWYQSKSRVFASEYLGKLLLARDALMQNGTAAAIVRVIVPDKPGAVDEVSGLASGLIAEMHLRFGGVPEGR